MEPFIGQIMMFGGNFAPRGWALCDGQLLPIASYSALFSIIGTFYGGDGRTTFALPDLRGRMPINYGTGPGLQPFQIGQKGGAEIHTLNQLEMPNHIHNGSTLRGVVQVNREDGTINEPENANFGIASSGTPFNTNATDASMGISGGNGNVSIQGNTGAAGGNQPFNIRNPYQAVNFVIALQGIFPSRN